MTSTSTSTPSLLLTTLLLFLSLLTSPSSAFYLPGAAPRDYKNGDRVPLVVNTLTPSITSEAQIRSMISYDFYNPRFHFCQPEDGAKKQPEALGSILFGDRLFNSAFEINMLQNDSCKLLCKTTIPPEDASFVNERVREDYSFNWLLDGLPAAEMKRDSKTGQTFYSLGFSLGQYLSPDHPSLTNPNSGLSTGVTVPNPIPGESYLNNHYDIFVEYHERDDGRKRVVGVVVWPKSVDNSPTGRVEGGQPQCDREKALVLNEDEKSRGNDVYWTYSVMWMRSQTPWATRWDNYLHIFDPKIHFFSLINSIVIAFFLTLMVAMILLRTVRRDISRYNAFDLSAEDGAPSSTGGGLGLGEVQEDFGWKLVHGEVFRRPPNLMFLSICVGSGSQMLAMCGVTLLFALFGFLSPSNRGGLSTVMILCWTLFGIVAGFVSSKVYQSLGGERWKQNLVFTALLFPAVLFGSLNLLNLFLIGAGSSGAVPFGTMLAIFFLWFLISTPLLLFGSYRAQISVPIHHPTKPNHIPRQIPPSPWYLRPYPSAILAGVLPFGAAFIEIYFVMSSLFGNKVYYAFGFLAATGGVVVLTTATTTILMCYFHLCAEEYRWHWRAFVTGGGSAFWLFAYGLVYWLTRLSLEGFASKVLYLGYLLLISLLDFVIMGTVGFIATYAFLLKIYSEIRVD